MRQRIVINLDEPKTEGAKPVRKRRRWVRVLGILALVVLVLVVVVAAGGFLLLRRYQSTPTYTIALMLDAAQRNDVAEFQKRIDEEEIAKNMAARVSEKGVAFNSSIHQAVRDEFFNAMKAFAAAPHQRSFISIVGAVQSLMTVTTDGDSAKATGKMAGHNIELAMRRDGDRWKVTEVKDEVILQRVVNNVMKELPQLGNIDENSPLLKQPQRRGSRRGR